jgi:hypothetical protein
MASKKYHQVKDITLKAVLDAGIALSVNMIRAWLDNQGYEETVNWEDDKEFRGFCHRCVITPQLEDAGFIKEKKPEKFYSIGQILVVDYYGEIAAAQIQACPNAFGKIFLAHLGTGTSWGLSETEVENVRKITEEEFAKITRCLKVKDVLTLGSSETLARLR